MIGSSTHRHLYCLDVERGSLHVPHSTPTSIPHSDKTISKTEYLEKSRSRKFGSPHQVTMSRHMRLACAKLPQHFATRPALPTTSPASILPRQFSHSARRNADFTHAVIGGGAVGLAIATRLQQHGNGVSTVLIEKHGAVGTETSSRNSEVSNLSYTEIEMTFGIPSSTLFHGN